jgi:hypothetical protein
MKKLLLIWMVFCMVPGIAQTDSTSGSKMFIRRILLENNQSVLNQKPIVPPQKMYSYFRKEESNWASKADVINLSTFSNYYVPNINLTDNLNNHYPINSRSWFNTSRTMTNYYGLGGINQIAGSYNFKMGNFGEMTTGIYAAKYNAYNHFNNDAGLNGNLKINITDNIKMNIFGQYTLNPMKNGIPPFMSTLYPMNNYGGSLEFKVNENWGLQVGAENEFDVISRKWVTNYFVMPVFYKH